MPTRPGAKPDSTELGVIDTDVVVLLEGLDPSKLPQRPVITAITLAELSVGPLVTDDPAERSARQIRLQEVEANVPVLEFGPAAARAFGQVASELRRSRRKASARAFDALIASVAIAEARFSTAVRRPRQSVGGLLYYQNSSNRGNSVRR